MSERTGELSALSPEERQAQLLERVNTSGRVLAAAAAIEFGVSEDSIRRDLRELAEAGLVQRFHGGAARLITPVLDFSRRERVDGGEKLRIGQAAAGTIEDGATLLVDSSTTTLHFLKELPASRSVRIITTSVDIAAAALDHPRADVTMLGGRLNRQTRSSTGPSALEEVRRLRPDVCVLGTCGIDERLNLRADDFDDAHIKAAMIKASAKTIVLAPREKLGRAATYEVAPISAISTLFTSTNELSITQRIQEQGIDVVFA
ncbi:MAG: DeoR/GlpR transcriptional regulator [Shinella sp.]|nr:MAG: DeoR/GlpR transcriptional regulator [Shinella sp.]